MYLLGRGDDLLQRPGLVAEIEGQFIKSAAVAHRKMEMEVTAVMVSPPVGDSMDGVLAATPLEPDGADVRPGAEDCTDPDLLSDMSSHRAARPGHARCVPLCR